MVTIYNGQKKNWLWVLSVEQTEFSVLLVQYQIIDRALFTFGMGYETAINNSVNDF